MLPFLPFLFAFLIVEQGARQHGPVLPLGEALPLVGGGLVLWWLLAEGVNRHIARRRSRRRLIWWDILTQGILLGGLAVLCVRLGWARLVPGSTLALLPYFIGLAIHWATYAVGTRAVTARPWTRLGMLVFQLRFTALPLLLGLSCIYDLSSQVSGRMLGHIPLTLQIGGTIILAAVAMILMPLMLVRLWGARPLGDEAKATYLKTQSARSGIRGLELRRFAFPHERDHNAMLVFAPIPRWRYVLISDGLLEDMPQEELVAVLGHELGHWRHRHLILYLVFIGAAMAVVRTVGLVIDQGWLPILDPLLRQSWGETALILAAAVVIWRGPFAWLSRSCERQADLAGADLAGSPQVMASALLRVARLSQEPEDASNWSHHSLAHRAAFMRAVAADPVLAQRHHHRMRLSLIVLLMVVLASLALQVWMQKPGATPSADQARTAMKAWADREPDLHDAIVAADNGDPAPLGSYYQRASRMQRQHLAALTLALAVDDQGQADDAELYRLRYRLMAFSGIDSGEPALNLSIDNALAYGVVAGTATPTQTDLDIARRLLPNLTEAVIAKPDHAILDTIGCVNFRLDDWVKARDAFQNALNHLDKSRGLQPADLDYLRKLYQSRLTAAQANLDRTEGTETLPLPLDRSAPAPATDASAVEATSP